jgi:crotonobetainyl-CoA:carnitine CoA-transferase CaiB-like acyl-CoA transferase
VKLPLDGIVVADLSRYVVGATVTRRLADLGARVIKLESPGPGDRLRALAPTVRGIGLWHLTENVNKDSVPLDLADPLSVRAVMEILDSADVIVESGGRNVLVERGIDLAEIRARRPATVICSITAFGTSGPWAGLTAHAQNIDALAGAYSLDHGRAGLTFSRAIYGGVGNEAAGQDGATAICAALLPARLSGRGSWLEVSCWDSAVYANRMALIHQHLTDSDLYDANDGEINGSRHSIYETSDGRNVYFAAIEEHLWKKFCVGIERLDLLEFEREAPIDFGNPELRAPLEALFAGRSMAHWQDEFTRLGVPGSALLTGAEVLASAHFASRDLLQDAQGVPFIATPVRWDGDTRPRAHDSTPPPDNAHEHKGNSS